MERANIRDFDEIFSIMEEAFPLNEYRSREKQRALFSLPEYSVYLYREKGKILGFLALWELCDLIFIEHFAIQRDLRGKGIGQRMLKELLSEKAEPICLEVELPESEIAKRRIAFYERSGLFYYDYPYVQPSMDEGRDPIPLRIMCSLPTLSEDGFSRIRDLLYDKVYGVNEKKSI